MSAGRSTFFHQPTPLHVDAGTAATLASPEGQHTAGPPTSRGVAPLPGVTSYWGLGEAPASAAQARGLGAEPRENFGAFLCIRPSTKVICRVQEVTSPMS